MFGFATFPSTCEADPHRALPSVCIITSELVGFFKNGGLGTATTGLAELLATHAFQITVIYTGKTDQSTDSWVQKYADAGISVELLGRSGKALLIGPHSYLNWTNPWNLYQTLKNQHFDVIHFNDTLGEGCYCFLAKRFGLAFENTLLALAVHSPVEWILESNRQPISNLTSSLWISGERLSLMAADLVWGPSNYLLNWLLERKYKLPTQVFQQQYAIPTMQLFEAGHQKYSNHGRPKAQAAGVGIQEIVFFGRLEERKGIQLFTAAINKLRRLIVEHSVSVLFLGKKCYFDDQPIQEYLEEVGASWGFEWRIEDSFDQQEAINYLQKPGKLAVMASPVDNSPCTVYEALIYRIPFIATRSGGIPELVRVDFHETHLFDYNINSLTDVLTNCIAHGISAAEPAAEQSDTRDRWIAFHSNWKSYLPEKKRIVVDQARWVVYVEYAGSSESLEETLNSVFLQDIEKPAKFIVNLNHQTAPEFDLHYDIVYLSSSQEAGVRETLVLATQSGFTHFLSLRGGIRLLSGALLTIGAALESEADAIVPALQIESNQSIFPPFAGCPTLAYLESGVDSGAICLKLQNKTFQNILPSLEEGRMHLGLLEELYASGGQIWPYPEVLLTADSITRIQVRETRQVQRLNAFSRAPRPDIYEMLSVAYSQYSTFQELEKPRYSPSGKSKTLDLILTFLFSNPFPVKAVLGNKLARKIVRLLYQLSRLS